MAYLDTYIPALPPGAEPVMNWEGNRFVWEPAPPKPVESKPKKVSRMYFPYEVFPYEKGATIVVDWKQNLDSSNLASISIDLGTNTGHIIVHPYTFCRMVGEKFGSMCALDMLKVIMKDRIANLAAKHFDKVETKLNKLIADASKYRNLQG